MRLYLSINKIVKQLPATNRELHRIQKLFAMFANLVANGARGFASGLAGSRAFAAAASAESFVKHSFINSFDMFTHSKLPPNKILLYLF